MLELEKAFDTIPLAYIWTSINTKKIDKDIIESINDLYENNVSHVIKDNERTDIFEIGDGHRQDAILRFIKSGIKVKI